MSADDFKTLREDLEARAFNNPRMGEPLRILDRIEASAAAMREALLLACDRQSESWRAWIHEEGCRAVHDEDAEDACDGRFIAEKVAAALATDADAGLLARLREAEKRRPDGVLDGTLEAHGELAVRCQKAEAERGHWSRQAEEFRKGLRDTREERDLLRAQRADLREELNRAALDLSAARAELAARDATLDALRDAVARLERATAPQQVHAP